MGSPWLVSVPPPVTRELRSPLPRLVFPRVVRRAKRGQLLRIVASSLAPEVPVAAGPVACGALSHSPKVSLAALLAESESRRNLPLNGIAAGIVRPSKRPSKVGHEVHDFSGNPLSFPGIRGHMEPRQAYGCPWGPGTQLG